MAVQTSFNAGEITPQLHGRGDLTKYASGCRTLKNFICLPHGPATRRTGLKHIDSTKDSTKLALLVPFEFSVDQAYMMEFGHQYIRFYKDDALILPDAWSAGTYYVGDQVQDVGIRYTCSAASTAQQPPHADWTTETTLPYELTTAYTESQLAAIDGAQSADTLYLGSPGHWPRELVRSGDADWGIDDIVFDPPPFLDENGDATLTLDVSAVTGAGVTLTASSALFSSNQVGSHFKISELIGAKYDEWETGTAYNTGDIVINAGSVYEATSTATSGLRSPIHLVGNESDGGVSWDYLHQGWGYVEITGFTSATVVTADVISRIPDSALNPATEHRWAEGAWSAKNGYPGAVTIHQQRIAWAKVASYPERMWLSRTGVYKNHSVSDVIVDDDALDLTLGTKRINAIQWIESVRHLSVGTTGAEWWITDGTGSGAITATSKQATPGSFEGSAGLPPVTVGNTLIFLQRHTKVLKELVYSWESETFAGKELTILAEHLTRDYGIVAMAFQREPYKVLWCVREDGDLLGLTYDKDQEVWGWHHHETDGYFESVAVIPGTTEDNVWFIVRRDIDGTSERYVERLADAFKASDTHDAQFLDSWKVYDGRLDASGNLIEISNITNADPAVVTTSINHGLGNADTVRLRKVVGVDEGGESLIEEFDFNITVLTATTFSLQNITTDVDIDTSGASAYVSGGTVGKRATAISGLGHLEGESVDILQDGAPAAPKTVASGSITLADPGSVVYVGLGYISDLATLPPLRVDTQGQSVAGQVQRVSGIVLQVFLTLGVQMGTDEDHLAHYLFTDDTVPEGRPAPLHTGYLKDISVRGGDFTRDPGVLIRQDQPLPLTVLSINTEMEDEDG